MRHDVAFVRKAGKLPGNKSLTPQGLRGNFEKIRKINKRSGNIDSMTQNQMLEQKMERSLEVITKSDLKKLLKLARGDIERFFARNPRYRSYEGKEALIALCQGSALHYLDKRNGVKDFDVWFFYPSDIPSLPYRRRGVVDFGESKFGVHQKMKKKGYLARIFHQTA